VLESIATHASTFLLGFVIRESIAAHCYPTLHVIRGNECGNGFKISEPPPQQLPNEFFGRLNHFGEVITLGLPFGQITV
jgi:hypothetical protein